MVNPEQTTTQPPLPAGQEPSVLSEQEKQHIREEMLLRADIRREMEQAEEAKESSKWQAFVNSPFVITLLGGLILAWVSGRIQENIAQHDKRQAYLLTLQNKKQDLLKTFGNEFWWVSITDMRDMSNLGYLNRYDAARDSGNKKALRHYKAEDVTRIEKDATEDTKFLRSHPSIDALCAQVKSLFDSPAVRTGVDKLNQTLINSLDDVSTAEKQEQEKIKITPLYNAVMSAMGDEIKTTAKFR
jgi:hypothetical protein